MYSFSYQRASSLDEARAALSADPDAKLLAGGMTLLPSMKHRLAAPSQLIDIGRLAGLRGIRRDRDALAIGAATRHGEIAGDATVRTLLPALAALAGQIGDPQVRARGTVGGSVANSDPAADHPAAVLGCRAVIVTDQRGIPADEFFQGMFSTALAPGEIITEIRYALPHRAAYAKFAHPASGYAMAGVFLAQFDDEVRVAITGAGPCVFRWREAEAALARGLNAKALDGLQLSADGLNADLHAPADYRAHLARQMTLQALAAIA